MKKNLFLLLPLLTISACVSSGKYDDLLKEKEEMETSYEKKFKEQEEKMAKELSEKSNLKNSIEEMKSALEELRKKKLESDARVAEFRSLTDKFKALSDSGALKVKIIDGRMVVVLSSDVLFETGQSILNNKGNEAIKEVTKILASIRSRKFQVEGHTDTDGSEIGNWRIAADRALNVVFLMKKSGMPVERVSAASYGQTRPTAPNDSPENKKLNRRIEIVVVPDLSKLPGYEELQKITD